MSKMLNESLTSYINHVLETLNLSYNAIDEKTRALLKHSDKLSREDKVHLEWGLAHLHTSLCEFERDLERHKIIVEKEEDAA